MHYFMTSTGTNILIGILVPDLSTSNFFVLWWRRTWRTRCTLLSRGDARCWRISTTPKASAKHQHPFFSPFPSSSSPFLPSDLCPAPSCCHSFVHSYCSAALSLPISFPPALCFPPLTPIALHSQDGTTLNPPPLIFSWASCFWLRSVTFPFGFTRWCVSRLITEGKFCVKEHRVIFSCQYYEDTIMQLPACSHARL